MRPITQDLPPEAEEHARVFQSSLPAQVRLHEVLRVLGPTIERTCLDVGAINGVMSRHLRQRGGAWQSVALDEEAAASQRAVSGASAELSESGKLPFDDKVFDVLVLFDGLEQIVSDTGFIRECHRVLKPDGRLIANVTNVKPATLIRPLQGILGMGHERIGLHRPGYSEQELFRLLKDGFDVMNMRTYMRFFVTFTDTIVRSLLRRRRAKGTHPPSIRFHSVCGFFYRVAYQLDLLLFMTRGHVAIATAKRRGWRPRKTPVLIDGRNISEAVLSRALD